MDRIQSLQKQLLFLCDKEKLIRYQLYHGCSQNVYNLLSTLSTSKECQIQNIIQKKQAKRFYKFVSKKQYHGNMSIIVFANSNCNINEIDDIWHGQNGINAKFILSGVKSLTRLQELQENYDLKIYHERMYKYVGRNPMPTYNYHRCNINDEFRDKMKQSLNIVNFKINIIQKAINNMQYVMKRQNIIQHSDNKLVCQIPSRTDSKIRNHGTDGYIYFIKALEKINRVKIGYSTNVLKRLKYSLQPMSPIKLQLIGMMRGSRSSETIVHSRFNKCKIHNEWFTLTSKLKKYIYNNCDIVEDLN